MIGRITKIDTLKSSRNKGQNFVRVHLQLVGNDGTKKYGHTDLVPSFRNYARWKKYLVIGNVLGNLQEIKDGKINADSFPNFIRKDDIQIINPPIIEKQQTLL